MRFLNGLLWLMMMPNSLAGSLNLMLLEQYKNQPLDGWVMSEKFDGVRGY